MDDTAIAHGSNISGLSLLLNVEKISNGIDIDDMEQKVKAMYVDNTHDIASDDEEAEEEAEADVLEEYEKAMEDIESVVSEEEEDDDVISEVASVRSRRSSHSVRPRGGFIPNPSDTFYTMKTRDDQLQSSIGRVMAHVPDVNIDMEQEIEEERKNTLLEQIESLRDDLGELGVSVDGSQFYAAYEAPLKRIEEVHRRLTFKYNKLKYNSIAEEALVAGASLLEMIFNGKHEYFGCKPDITGYSDVVKSKLKRIRVETSTAVSRFVAKNNVGVMPRLMMELLPSLITQSQRRKLQAGDSLNANVAHSKNSIRSHISDLNNMM